MDHYSQFDAFATRCGAFSNEELYMFHQLARYSKIQKKSILLREGDICDFEAYVISGCLRSYCLDENGVETVLQFAVEDWWISDMASFHERTPSKMNIEALEDCELLMLSVQDKQILLKQVPKFERMFRLMVQRHLIATQNRLIDALSRTAMERYQEFLKTYPNISQRVAQHHIAAYLGISPEFLSKIRGRIGKNV